MILLPAIDLKDGQAVRLKKGDFNEKTVYSDRPWEIAIEFEKAGAGFIHLVDLDGALAGYSVNEAVIRKITEAVTVPVELGGGIRDLEKIEYVLGMGVYRVILGTSAVKDPGFVKEAVEKFGADRIVAGIDAKNGLVATDGWEKVSDITSVDMAVKMKEAGVKTIIYTDISKDGMMSGPNIEQTKKLSEETGLDIIASGGVSCMKDLADLNEAGIYGSIIGKAYYEKKIDIKEAVGLFSK
ncbi:MAG: 1-(5-phosphoribosyl)-5-[(5-phosphoribosylamino)methylideneamino]imidazole-4-carboxamide isomerase [Clostridiales bacterium]|nr:1-(5-phosphoribosyl)-5-[(5-phosphoribosylamino)methylideneamino]imidazole-4-carboxamide isomerase [Clostridiales bacterium]MBS5877139.1 1-(5-phosphoribosyl)-5-[(5-phosphoribosylamino)methylideneamino]imidazole-4-carboxamide isomerase [Clostridiales bacterium]MDU0939020.1 1-(5-phosphoribosyl)-5-[(5-phosphoribosylamino)methylideneamino]imidazole-4-carboxamide isomerase [Clostridiales bacterium]MDU1041845.1 1-(5-phosphoribosyl)-5-[(5-phosphoribosylamino)methylideneamino]imidazole-4-carboxamide i